MATIAELNRELACASWEAGLPGIGTGVLVTRRSRVMTTLAALLALSLAACAPIGAHFPARRAHATAWCSDALPGAGQLTVCRESQLTCEAERSESQDMGPCILR